MRQFRILAALLVLGTGLHDAAAQPPLPSVASGWKVELIAEAPDVLFPTAAVVAPDGAIYVGQDPMDMPGPPTQPIDSIVRIKDGKIGVFAEKLWAVMGLEWVGDTLYVVHAPYLSALRDTDGDGKADSRLDLVTGLGPKLPGFSGINDHVASGLRLGMDGYLYISVGDKGIPRATGKDGATLSLHGGGVVRVRPDGTGLEVFSTGERNPLSTMLTAGDDVFTYGNDDDSKRWPNSLTHHILDANFGYPYQFQTAIGAPVTLPGGLTIRSPRRCLPVVGGQIGGSGTQGVCYLEPGAPERYQGNLFVTDWGLGAVIRYEIEPSGATFKVKSREEFLTAGKVPDFRPFSIAVSPVDGSLLVVDWAFTGWLTDGPQTGRLYRVSYIGDDKPPFSRPLSSRDPAILTAQLDHPSRTVRLDAERALIALGANAVPSLSEKAAGTGTQIGRIQALWTLGTIGGAESAKVVADAFSNTNPSIRSQAARIAGTHPSEYEFETIVPLLTDTDPSVRREAAIALGRLGETRAAEPLYGALGDPDLFVAWSVRKAIHRLKVWDRSQLLAALLDPKRRDDALDLTDETWAVPVVQALTDAFARTADPAVRIRLVVNLAGLYRKYPPWSGQWFGTNPLVGILPQHTMDWSPEGMGLVRAGLASALDDETPHVRREAIAGLRQLEPIEAARILVPHLKTERDPSNIAAICRAIGLARDPAALEDLTMLLLDPNQPVDVRIAAEDAASVLPARNAVATRMQILYDPKTPPALAARTLLNLAATKSLPPNDLSEFLGNPSPALRIATLQALSSVQPLSQTLKEKLVTALADPDMQVRDAAISAVAAGEVREAVPKLIELANSGSDPAVQALTQLPDSRALSVYLTVLNGEDAGRIPAVETALAAIREVASPVLENQANSGLLKPRALEAAERITTKTLPVRYWRVIGPFARTTARVFIGEPTIDFAKVHSGVEGRPIRWQPLRGEPGTGRVVLEPFKGGAGDKGGFGYDTNGSPDLCAFGYAEIPSKTERPALLFFGSSGSMLVTLNERVVYNTHFGAGREYAPKSDGVRVVLKPGQNRLLVMSRQGIGTWTFSIQASDPAVPLLAAAPAKPELNTFREFATSHDGDAARGRAIFFDAKGIGCVKCHAAEGQGSGNIGPDLTGLAAKYDRQELIRSVLEPSLRLATGYQPVLVAKEDGTVLTGLIRAETDAVLDLVDSDARLTRVPKAEIQERRIGDVSIMPAGLVDSLSVEQFADLIAYLATLKAPAATDSPAK
jgi:putative membrane-bound dehydrogenase-like protein